MGQPKAQDRQALEQDDLLTLAQAAWLLGLSPSTLRWQVHNGKLRASKLGPVWVTTQREVDRYAREQRRSQ